jgi:hypothetical protein
LYLSGPAVLLRGPPFTDEPGGVSAAARERADGIELVDPRSGALVQEWTLRGDKVERCRTTFHPGTVVPAVVRCDQDPHTSGAGSAMEDDRQLFFSADGLPTEEVLTSGGRLLLGTASTLHTRLRYDGWTPCAEDAAPDAFVPEEAVELLPDVDPVVVLGLDPEVPPLEQQSTLLLEQYRVARRRFRQQVALTSLSAGLTATLTVMQVTRPADEWRPGDAVAFGLGLGFSGAGLTLGAGQLVRQGRQLREAKTELEAASLQP